MKGLLVICTLLFLRCFFGVSISFSYNIPPLHILRCASSRTSFKGGDVMVSTHEKLCQRCFKGGDVMVSTHEKLCQHCFKGGDVMVSIQEPHNSIIYLISDSYQLFILRCFFGIPISFVYNIPPLHILRCASSRTSFKGGDVTVSTHEKLCQRCFNSIIYLISDSYQLFILRCFFAYRSLFLYCSYIECKG